MCRTLAPAMPPTCFPLHGGSGEGAADRDPAGGVPMAPSLAAPHHLLRLCSKDDQLFISSMAGAGGGPATGQLRLPPGPSTGPTLRRRDAQHRRGS